MTSPARPRRSALYLPASNPKALAKAQGLPVDCVILDLEDSVAPDGKVEARAAAVAAVQAGGWGRRELVVRANGLNTPWGADDLAAIAAAGPDAVLVPKIDGVADVHAYDAALAAAPAQTRLWVMIDDQMDKVPGAGQAKAAMSMMPDLRGAQNVIQAMQGVISSGGNAFESMQKVMGDFTRMMPGMKR